MKLFIDDEEITEIEPISKSEDKGIVINPTVGKRNEGKSDLVKEITAYDSLTIGPVRAAQINGVPESSASKYKDGKDIEDADVRARINATRYNIQDTAVAKLMETLNILDPTMIEKPRDQIAVAVGLSSIVEKMGDKGNNTQQVHLHLYAPEQKKESQYTTIDV